MILAKRKNEIVQGALECFTLTLELQTPFGEEPYQVMVLEHIQRELPLSCERAQNRISFIPLISFNSSVGRTHRFLVAFALKDFSADRFLCDRVLPLGVIFCAYAEQQMLENEGFENLICGGFIENNLFLLIFWEGKLMHWIQESAKQENFDWNKRLYRLKLFMQQDTLLSRLGDCPISIASDVEVSSFFEKTVHDPIWRFWDLDPSLEMKERAWKRLQRRFIYAFLILIVFFISIFFLHQFMFSSKQIILVEQKRQQIQQDSVLKKIVDFQNQILSLPYPLEIDLVLSEFARIIAKGTRLESLKKYHSEDGLHFVFHISALHFEEASRIQSLLKTNSLLNIQKISLGDVQSTVDNRVTFQMDLFL